MSAILSILPFLTNGDIRAMKMLVTYFEPKLLFDELDQILDNKNESATESVTTNKSALPTPEAIKYDL